MADIILTSELAHHLDDPEFVLVDAREIAAFNGWAVHGEVRGGHISGAVAFPLAWLGGGSASSLAQRLAQKGVTADKTVVVYARQRDHSAAMVARLETLGYPRVRMYDAGFAEWAADATLPIDRLAHYDHLVPPAWLYQIQFGMLSQPASSRGCLLLDVGVGDATAYATGHIPGALSFPIEAVERAPLWNRVPDADLNDTLVGYGITYDTTVVLYSRDTTAAARVASLLLYAGVDDVRLVDGGFAAWLAAGYPVEILSRRPTPVPAFGRPIPGPHPYIIEADEVHAVVADDQASLVDIRSWSEYIGATSGYSYIRPKGRIAGTVWGHAGAAPRRMDHYHNVDHTMRSYPEIAASWRAHGITPEQRVVFYCGTGWRASEAFFYAYLMGWRQISVYDGGWLEWSRKPFHPIAIGHPDP